MTLEECSQLGKADACRSIAGLGSADEAQRVATRSIQILVQEDVYGIARYSLSNTIRLENTLKKILPDQQVTPGPSLDSL